MPAEANTRASPNSASILPASPHLRVRSRLMGRESAHERFVEGLRVHRRTATMTSLAAPRHDRIDAP
jgi:hypothetical protein